MGSLSDIRTGYSRSSRKIDLQDYNTRGQAILALYGSGYASGFVGSGGVQTRRLSPERYDIFLAEITGNASLATNRWKYAWREVILDGDDVATVTGGRSGTSSANYAINLIELKHTATYAWGVDITASGYAGTSFAPRPIGGGGADNSHRYNVTVPMLQSYDKNGDVKYAFSLMGTHDGSC